MSLAYLQAESTPLHPDDIWGLKWTRNNHLVSACADGHLRVFDATQPSAPVHDIAANPLAITALSVAADGRRAATSSLEGSVVLSDLEEGRVLGRVETGRGGEVAAYACSLHPVSSVLAWSGRSSKVALRRLTAVFSASEGDDPLAGETTVVDTGKGKFGMELQFSPDGRQIASSTDNGYVTIIDVEAQSVVASYQSHALAVRALSWSHDSQWLFSGSDDHRIVLHDIRAGKTSSGKGEGAVAILQGHQSWVLSVAAGPDGRLLGSTGADRQVRLWDIAQRTSVFTSTTSAPVWAFDWQPADVTNGSLGVGKQFAVGGDEKSLKAMSVVQGYWPA